MTDEEILIVVNRLFAISGEPKQIGQLVHEMVERDEHAANKLYHALGFELEDKHRRENSAN